MVSDLRFEARAEAVKRPRRVDRKPATERTKELGNDRLGFAQATDLEHARGASPEDARTAARIPGFTGFAVGRTVFCDPLVDYRVKKATREGTVGEIA